ncbi:hypothetical protein J2847_006647 [Azospirillum agricola]|uniref:hypothetical protein n=1 Tax=Azospirillum agricola TaxID=1720247 RepID=UPI001AE70F45|nr:hypothetical protein [Azospirillum agricola]MBP2233310.1 hypothetical protein [Azospirillum agricola]
MPAALQKPRTLINVEMDERTVLFPDGKFLSHVSVFEEDGRVRLEAVFLFNESRQPADIATLDAEDARELARAVMDGVFQGRTQHVLSDTAKVALIFNPNGFILRFGEGAALRELFVASPAIIRLAQGLLRMVDRLSAAPAH